jgi:hypothetical protein
MDPMRYAAVMSIAPAIAVGKLQLTHGKCVKNAKERKRERKKEREREVVFFLLKERVRVSLCALLYLYTPSFVPSSTYHCALYIPLTSFLALAYAPTTVEYVRAVRPTMKPTATSIATAFALGMRPALRLR